MRVNKLKSLASIALLQPNMKGLKVEHVKLKDSHVLNIDNII